MSATSGSKNSHFSYLAVRRSLTTCRLRAAGEGLILPQSEEVENAVNELMKLSRRNVNAVNPLAVYRVVSIGLAYEN
ncbi:MAG: hypothetical protein H0V76_10520 [Blastocatellia bacterium]|nr:hypothetical protein [Blastocatellia bacterium]